METEKFPINFFTNAKQFMVGCMLGKNPSVKSPELSLSFFKLKGQKIYGSGMEIKKKTEVKRIIIRTRYSLITDNETLIDNSFTDSDSQFKNLNLNRAQNEKSRN